MVGRENEADLSLDGKIRGEFEREGTGRTPGTKMERTEHRKFYKIKPTFKFGKRKSERRMQILIRYRAEWLQRQGCLFLYLQRIYLKPEVVAIKPC